MDSTLRLLEIREREDDEVADIHAEHSLIKDGKVKIFHDWSHGRQDASKV